MRKGFFKISQAVALALAMLNTGCAVLYHTQVGEVNSKVVTKGHRFEIMVSETGVSISDIANIGKAMTQSRETQKQIGDAEKFINMFQMGPRTGMPVYNDKYADEIRLLLIKECPRGKISGLTSIREMRKYPVISGEIVRIIGFCLEGA